MHDDLVSRGRQSADGQVADRQIVDRLKALAGEGMQPYGWDEFRRRAQAHAVAHARLHAQNGLRRGIWRRFSAVAAALLVFVVGAVIWSHARRPQLISRDVTVSPVSPVFLPSTPGSRPLTDVEAAERWLANAPSEPVIVRFGTRVAVFGLEDRIGQVDDLLTAANTKEGPPADVVALHEERDRLVSSLAQVRYAETLVAESP